jgi:2-keto-4-pentenoate hydratase/2-oxohepta-3-ene-1,7-dioic acid hydratase in catechol pathway
MKIVFVEKNNQFRLIPDSALLLKNRPLFRPDYVQTLHAKIALVVKINRLGKYIQEKFASTYYDEIGFALNFYDKDCLETLVQNGFPWERATCFDGSFALSEFTKISDITEHSEITFLKNSDINLKSKHVILSKAKELKNQKTEIPLIISELSTYMTLKIGDYIALELDEPASAPFAINDVLRLSLNNEDMLQVAIK